jgi:chromosome segregation ATPase
LSRNTPGAGFLDGFARLATLSGEYINPAYLSEHGEHNPNRQESERSELLVEYEELDAEFHKLEDLWATAKKVIGRPWPKAVPQNVEQLLAELGDLHRRQHEILVRQEQIEQRLLRSR